MTREKALQIARVVENLENFEAFIEEITLLAAVWDEQLKETDFFDRLFDFLEEERKKREEILEKM